MHIVEKLSAMSNHYLISGLSDSSDVLNSRIKILYQMYTEDVIPWKVSRFANFLIQWVQPTELLPPFSAHFHSYGSKLEL